MKEILKVKNLCKSYPSFSLKNVSFSVKKGEIMGFIGRNGAGKTTAIKSILGLLRCDSGDIEYFSMPLYDNELQIKARIGYAAGGVDFYDHKKIKEIADIEKSFYPDWDDEIYKNYLAMFSLDENKKIIQLSDGMKVKFRIAMALSHNAKLLILDEPTSGLDPVSREDLLKLFSHISAQGVSILFSTHIISDLEKCADSITYIKNGEIVCSQPLHEFKKSYNTISDNIEDIMLCIENGGKNV